MTSRRTDSRMILSFAFFSGELAAPLTPAFRLDPSVLLKCLLPAAVSPPSGFLCFFSIFRFRFIDRHFHFTACHLRKILSFTYAFGIIRKFFFIILPLLLYITSGILILSFFRVTNIFFSHYLGFLTGPNVICSSSCGCLPIKSVINP